MTVKKAFPYKAALVACHGGCRTEREENRCTYGCTGCGDCVSACRFGAVAVNGGVAAVSEEKCTACGACVRACPQGIIRLHACANHIVVRCSNRDRGALTRKQCRTGCIGCGVCEKTCSSGAVQVRDNLAVIDESLCLSCGMCAVRCPRHAIADLRGILTDVRGAIADAP